MKSRIVITLVNLCTLQLLFAQTGILGSSDNSGQKEESANTFWAHHHNMVMNVAYGNHPDQRVDIYTQGSYVGEPNWFERNKKVKPTLVWIHGGGWRFGNKETDAWFFVHFLERGWNVVNVEHRKGIGTAPDAAEDVLSVIKWISENSEEYGLDTDKIVVSGASSGGHLALLAGLINSVPKSHPSFVGDKVRIRAIINWYGIADLQKMEDYLSTHLPDQNFILNWVKGKQGVQNLLEKYSPIQYVTKNAPPVLTIQGDLDTLTPYHQAQLLHEKLEKMGTENQLLTVKGGKHLGFTENQFQLIFKTIFKFLEANP